MSLILDRVSPRFDIWEENEPVAHPQLAQGMGDAVQGVVDLALLVASPLIVLTDWISSLRQPANAPPDWTYGGEVGNWKVWSQTWLYSEDFPKGLDYYADPQEVYALLRFRFTPEIEEWESRYFFEESLLCPEGLYLLSYVPGGEGMALHLLPVEGDEPETLAIVSSQEWELNGQEGGGLMLEAPLETGLGQVFVARRF